MLAINKSLGILRCAYALFLYIEIAQGNANAIRVRIILGECIKLYMNGFGREQFSVKSADRFTC